MDNYKVKLILLDDKDNPISGMVATSKELNDLRKSDISPMDEMLKSLLDKAGFLDRKRKVHRSIQLLAKISNAQISKIDRERTDHYRDIAQIIDNNSREEAISMLCVSGLWFGTEEELEALWR